MILYFYPRPCERGDVSDLVDLRRRPFQSTPL